MKNIKKLTAGTFFLCAVSCVMFSGILHAQSSDRTLYNKQEPYRGAIKPYTPNRSTTDRDYHAEYEAFKEQQHARFRAKGEQKLAQFEEYKKQRFAALAQRVGDNAGYNAQSSSGGQNASQTGQTNSGIQVYNPKSTRDNQPKRLWNPR